MKTKVIAVLLSIVILIPLFAGCTKQQGGVMPNLSATDKPDTPPDAEKETPVPQQSVEPDSYQELIQFCLRNDFSTVNTQNTTGLVDQMVYKLVFNNLLEYNYVEDKLTLGLAESYKLISPTVLELNLRKGVKFHNDVEFTAENVEFTFMRGKEQSVAKTKLYNYPIGAD